MKKEFFLIILILVLSILLRFFYLSKVPIGLYSDEASFSYNAYSLLKTGKDEYGIFLPLMMKAFGEYKAAFISYFLIPFIWLNGLSVASVRSGSAFLGVIEIILIFLLVKEMFKSRKLALLTSFLVSVSPLNLQFNRMVHENNLSVVLMTLGIYFFILSLKSRKYLFASIMAFAASLYTYNDARVLVPLMLPFLIFYYRDRLWKAKKTLILGCIAFGLLIIPLVNLFTNKAVLSRPRNVMLFSDLGSVLLINQERGESKYMSFFNPRLFHNKLVIFSKKFLENYFKHFDSDFLYFKGDPVKIYSTVGNGILYLVEFPFLYLGLYYLFEKRVPNKGLLLFWLIIAPIPAALTKFVPSASRILSILPPLSIIPALGIYAGSKYFVTTASKKNIYTLFLTMFFSLNMVYYLHYYYINTPVRYAKEWHYGMEEVIDKVKNLQDQYSSVWFSKKAWGYIYPLFFMEYPPWQYQSQAKLGPLDEYGFGWVEGFDKYKFERIPKYFDFSQDILYIVAGDEIPSQVEPLYKILYPDAYTAFQLVDSGTLQKFCPKCSLSFIPVDEDIFGNKILKKL